MRLMTNIRSTTTQRDRQPSTQTGAKSRYEEFTPHELAQLRSSGADGEAKYQGLRADWIAAGKPRGDVSVSIFAAQRYEQLTPSQLAHLRSSGDAGEARYQELRTAWEERGQPPGGNAA